MCGFLVTKDAMGCQMGIPQEIVDANADYVLAVKGNQPTLHEGIAEFFLKHLENDFAGVKVSRYEKCERGHGREEHRSYYVLRGSRETADRSPGLN